MNPSSNPWDYLSKLGIGIHYYHLNDDKIKAGNKICKPYIKQPCEVEISEPEREDIICDALGCYTTFSSISELEVHQQARHTHVCATCRVILPSHHLLDRHILEIHDSFFQICAQKKAMYACLLEFCQQVFQTPLERKEHCIKEHKFPSDFRYDLQFRKLKLSKQNESRSTSKANHIYQRHNNLRLRNSNNYNHSSQTESTEARLMDNPDEMECINAEDPPLHVSKPNIKAGSVRMVPKSVSFGAGIPRGFITYRGKRGKHWHQRSQASDIPTYPNQINMSEMNQVLEEMES